MPNDQFPSQPQTDTTNRVLEAARLLFLQSGLKGVNMDAIAKEAGVARQTLYNQFGSKEAIFSAALEHHWSRFAWSVDVTLDPHRSPGLVLADVGQAIIDFVNSSEQISMIRTVIADGRHAPGLEKTFYFRGKKPLFERFSKYLKEATDLGQLECLDPQLAAHMFLGMLQEPLLWPRVMNTGEAIPDFKSVNREAVRAFLAAYEPRRDH